MAGAQLLYTKQALRDLQKIATKEAQRIVRKIAENSSLDNPLQRAKPLSGELAGMYRYRIGPYRAVFELDNYAKVTVVTVVAVRHRKDIYRQ